MKKLAMLVIILITAIPAAAQYAGGSGTSENPFRIDALRPDQMGNSVGNDLGLARTGACQQQQRPFGMQHCFKLLWIEGIQTHKVTLFRKMMTEISLPQAATGQ